MFLGAKAGACRVPFRTGERMFLADSIFLRVSGKKNSASVGENSLLEEPDVGGHGAEGATFRLIAEKKTTNG